MDWIKNGQQIGAAVSTEVKKSIILKVPFRLFNSSNIPLN